MTFFEMTIGQGWYLCIYELIAKANRKAYFFIILFWYLMQINEDQPEYKFP